MAPSMSSTRPARRAWSRSGTAFSPGSDPCSRVWATLAAGWLDTSPERQRRDGSMVPSLALRACVIPRCEATLQFRDAGAFPRSWDSDIDRLASGTPCDRRHGVADGLDNRRRAAGLLQIPFQVRNIYNPLRDPDRAGDQFADPGRLLQAQDTLGK